MKALRNIILLLSFTLPTVVARMIIDGPSLLAALTAAVIIALLLGSWRLRQEGRRIRPGADPKSHRSRAARGRQG